METNKPLVSVIMPAYNAERFIEAAVRSVMAQTIADWELLILDDGSKDTTAAIAARLASEDDRIRFLPNEANMGVAKTRNRGFGLCRGQFVALLDSDDIWLPEKLEKQLDLAEKTGADIIYCSYGIMDEKAHKVCEDFIVPPIVSFDQFLTQSVISCSTALLSRKIVDRYRFMTTFYHEDLALWLQLLQDGYQAQGVTEVLAQYRIMQGSRASNKLKSAVNRWRIYRKHLGLPVGKSLSLLTEYAFLGFKKYRKQ